MSINAYSKTLPTTLGDLRKNIFPVLLSILKTNGYIVEEFASHLYVKVGKRTAVRIDVSTGQSSWHSANSKYDEIYILLSQDGYGQGIIRRRIVVKNNGKNYDKMFVDKVEEIFKTSTAEWSNKEAVKKREEEYRTKMIGLLTDAGLCGLKDEYLFKIGGGVSDITISTCKYPTLEKKVEFTKRLREAYLIIEEQMKSELATV